MVDRTQILVQIAADHEGVITTKDAQKQGIPRVDLKKYLDNGFLIKSSQGIYHLSGQPGDQWKLFQSRSVDKLIFSHESALYLQGKLTYTPDVMDVMVPQGYNVTRLNASTAKVRFHYVKPERHADGRQIVKTPLGASVLCYCPERALCDLIHDHDQTDPARYRKIIRSLLPELSKTEEFDRFMRDTHVEEAVQRYLEVI